MRRPPPEIDQLLWLVAESSDPAAVRDFEQRFPDYMLELGKRTAMVRDLQVARQHLPSRAAVPRFQVPRSAPSLRPQRIVWALSAAMIATAGIAAFFTARHLMAPPVQPEGSTVVRNQISPEPNSVVFVEPGKQPGPIPDTAGSTLETAPANAQPTHLLPISYQKNNVRLETALDEIAKQCGLIVEVGPGLANIEIDVSFVELTGAAMISALGSKYGFTVFDEGNGTLLVIPTVDKSAPATPPKAGVQPNEPNRGSGNPDGSSGSDASGGSTGTANPTQTPERSGF